jgi:serine/threonine protein kinase
MLQLFEGNAKFSLRLTPWSLVNQDKFHFLHFLTDPSEKFHSFLGCCLHKDPMKRSTVEELFAHRFITEVPNVQSNCQM